MPFTKHIIEPINIAQCPLPPGEPNELECLSNLTLANVIRQLSSLGQHAGRLFDELVQDAVKCQTRLQLLDARMHSLKSKCSQLDIQNEEVSVDDAKTKKQFKSSVKLDQQVVSRRTMPDSIRLLYEQADPPPALDKLNPYRTDGKDCMKFYTDPGFFFNIWCNELIKDNETRKNEKKKRKSRGDKQTPKAVSSQNQNNSHYADPNLAALKHQQQQQLAYPDSPHAQSLMQQQQQQNYSAYHHQQQIYMKSPPPGGAVGASGYYINNNINNDQIDENGGSSGLPPPPPPQQSSLEIYAESSRMNNGARSAKLNVQQANVQMQQQQQQMTPGKSGSSHYGSGVGGAGAERPLLPPPPVPSSDNHFSDLQQIQQQMISKFDGLTMTSCSATASGLPTRHLMPDSNGNNGSSSNDHGITDLPLPPPPLGLDSNGVAGLPLYHHSKLPAQNHHHNHHLGNFNDNETNSNDMPLPPPPPPIDLLQGSSPSKMPASGSAAGNNGNGTNNQALLPPPPPLPPLVEPDTTSSSNSSLSASANGGGGNGAGASSSGKGEVQGTQTVGRSFLEDISKGRFVLKPTQVSLEERLKKTNSTPATASNENGRDIQPLMNNTDVAAIIDFVRRMRPHVGESSEEETNSEWDE